VHSEGKSAAFPPESGALNPLQHALDLHRRPFSLRIPTIAD
jgi:hypothetical protein